MGVVSEDISGGIISDISEWHREKYGDEPLLWSDFVAEFCFDWAWEECIEPSTAQDVAEECTDGEINTLPDDVKAKALDQLEQMLIDHDLHIDHQEAEEGDEVEE